MEKVRLINAKLLDLSKVIVITLLLFNTILIALEITGILNQLQVKTIALANASTIEHTFSLMNQIMPIVAICSFLSAIVAYQYDEDPYPLLFFVVSAITVLLTARVLIELLLP